MTRTRALIIAAVLALVPATLVPATQVSAQSREASRDQDREAAQDRRGPPPRDSRAMDAPRADLGAVVRRVGAGREGRMLGVSPRGDTVVVRWEYPGGRVADIRVDARSGRVMGED